MSTDTIFTVANLLVVPGWLMLVFAPRWKPGTRLICPVVIPGLLGLLYVGLFVTNLGRAPGGGFGSLEEIGTLFAVPELLLVGWVHYLAFDLFVGAWEVRDAQALGLPHLLVVPCLLFTLMAGPAGLLLYFFLRAGLRKQIEVAAEG